MAKENETTRTLLRGKEQLWDVALRGIGIQLPDEYVLRVVGLIDLAGRTPLGSITLDDMTDIETAAREEMARRSELPKLQPADQQPADAAPGDEERKRVAELLRRPIKDCDLSVRTRNICKENGIETLGNLAQIRKTDWLKFRNGGKKSLTELDDLLTSLGLTWGMDVDLYLNNKED